MALRSWNGDGSYLNVPVTADLDPINQMTIAALIYPRVATGTILSGTDSGGTGRWEFGIRSDNHLPYFFVRRANGSTVFITSTGSAVAANTWQIVGWTGFSTRAFHLSALGSGTWEHAGTDLAGSLDPMVSIAGGYMSIGWNLDALMAVLGLWSPSGLDNTHVEALDDNSKTLDFTAMTPAPLAVWNFDQTVRTADVPDLTGRFATITGSISGSDDANGIQGTTIVTGSDPTWNFVVPPPPLVCTLRLSGGAGNSDVRASHGGAESSVVPVSLLPAFDRLEAILGITYYCCAYVHNEDTLSPATVTAYFSTLALSSGVTLAIGVDPAASGAIAQSLPNSHTAPSGVTFSAPTVLGSAVNLGTIGPGDGKAVWLRVTIPASNAGSVHNGWALTFDVTPL